MFAKVPGWDFAPFASLIWSECCSVPDKALLCTKLDSGIGRQIWEIFLGLDVDSHGKIHVDDLSDLIQRVLRENGHMELEQNIKEWFCDEILVDFWSFFAAIVENYSGLLKVTPSHTHTHKHTLFWSLHTHTVVKYVHTHLHTQHICTVYTQVTNTHTHTLLMYSFAKQSTNQSLISVCFKDYNSDQKLITCNQRGLGNSVIVYFN